MYRHLWFFICMALLLGAGSAQAVSKRELEERIVRLERLIEQQSEMFLRMQQLQREMRGMHGDLEVQGHSLERIQNRQREIYRDLDDRLGKLEHAAASKASDEVAPDTANGAVGAEQNSAAGMEEQQAYQQALTNLRELKYVNAIKGFGGYLNAYPEGRYAVKAQYWLGEIRYVRGAYKQAIVEYRKLLKAYPGSAKSPEAMLKIGLSYRELGQKKAARQQLTALIARFPDSPEAGEANKHLK